ncbi:hypothetical protein ACGFZ3_17765 [Stenotrophomonas sp. NPDC047960]|uniref:hypothetical protein n=1 Tax=Stenotrophomonas sp. NPDC047960 TaxID=3364531 RepID=UPI0037102546
MLLAIDFLTRFWTDMIDRTDGPMTFRFMLQPTMALITALIDGIRAARAGKPPYAWLIAHSAGQDRLATWREGVTATARILLLGVVMDVIYQIRVYGSFRYPLESFVVAVGLAFIPYLVLRGPFTRLAAHWLRTHPAHDKGSRQ